MVINLSTNFLLLFTGATANETPAFRTVNGPLSGGRLHDGEGISNLEDTSALRRNQQIELHRNQDVLFTTGNGDDSFFVPRTLEKRTRREMTKFCNFSSYSHGNASTNTTTSTLKSRKVVRVNEFNKKHQRAHISFRHKRADFNSPLISGQVLKVSTQNGVGSRDIQGQRRSNAGTFDNSAILNKSSKYFQEPELGSTTKKLRKKKVVVRFAKASALESRHLKAVTPLPEDEISAEDASGKTVALPELFAPSKTSVTTRAGQTASLTCIVRNLGNRQVRLENIEVCDFYE